MAHLLGMDSIAKERRAQMKKNDRLSDFTYLRNRVGSKALRTDNWEETYKSKKRGPYMKKNLGWNEQWKRRLGVEDERQANQARPATRERRAEREARMEDWREGDKLSNRSSFRNVITSLWFEEPIDYSELERLSQKDKELMNRFMKRRFDLDLSTAAALKCAPVADETHFTAQLNNKPELYIELWKLIVYGISCFCSTSTYEQGEYAKLIVPIYQKYFSQLFAQAAEQSEEIKRILSCTESKRPLILRTHLFGEFVLGLPRQVQDYLSDADKLPPMDFLAPAQISEAYLDILCQSPAFCRDLGRLLQEDNLEETYRRWVRLIIKELTAERTNRKQRSNDAYIHDLVDRLAMTLPIKLLKEQIAIFADRFCG